MENRPFTEADVLMVDEASMIDDSNWLIVKDQLPSVGAACPQLVADMHPKGNDFEKRLQAAAASLVESAVPHKRPRHFRGVHLLRSAPEPTPGQQ